MLVKIDKYIAFGVYHRSCLLWSPVIVKLEKKRCVTATFHHLIHALGHAVCIMLHALLGARSSERYMQLTIVRETKKNRVYSGTFTGIPYSGIPRNTEILFSWITEKYRKKYRNNFLATVV